MTAIGIVGTKAGFVIGADGRMRATDESRTMADQVSLASETDEARKIFEIIDRDRVLAYAVTGFVKLGAFLVWEEMRRKIAFLSSRDFGSCKKYVTALCDRLTDDLNQAAASHTTGPLPAGTYKTERGDAWKIFDIFTVGYFKGVPSLIVSQFYHSNGIRVDCDVNSYPYKSTLLSGSALVKEAMYPERGGVADARFSAYTKQLSDSSSLQDAADYVKGYISACSSDLAREMDYDKWKIIGGHIHIAHVAPSSFEWMRPPKQLASHL